MSKNGKAGLPAGWAETTLGEIVILNPRGWESELADDEVVSFVPMAAVEAGSGKMDASQHRLWREVKKGYTTFQEGDVLFAKITPCMENGKCTIAQGLMGGRGAGSTEFHVLRPTQAISAKLLLYFLLQESFRREARAIMKGAAGQLRVPPEFLQGASFRLAPHPEQRRIVTEIEKQFTRLDAGVAALERAQANLKRYRASVLKAACEGRVVPTEAELARAEGRDYEPADRLLTRILKDRHTKWEADQLANMQVQGKVPKDDKWKGKYQEPVGPDAASLPELPEGWGWASLIQLGFVESGQTPKGVENHIRKQGEIPWFKIGDMNRPGNERFMKTASSWISWDAARTLGFHIHPAGTITFPKRGGAIATNKKRLLTQPGCYDLNTMGLIIDPRILAYVWWWFAGVDLDKLSDGSNVPQINHGDVEPLPVPIPPFAEQHRIIAEVERRLSVIDELEATVTANLKRAERLRQSILKRAFEGRLVLKDPHDEPVSALLERIRAERQVEQKATAKAVSKPNQKSKRSQVAETQAELFR